MDSQAGDEESAKLSNDELHEFLDITFRDFQREENIILRKI